MACEYTGIFTASLFSSYEGPSIQADFVNRANPKFHDELVYLNITPEVNAKTLQLLSLSLTHTLEASLEDPVMLTGCLWKHPLT